MGKLKRDGGKENLHAPDNKHQRVYDDSDDDWTLGEVSTKIKELESALKKERQRNGKLQEENEAVKRQNRDLRASSTIAQGVYEADELLEKVVDKLQNAEQILNRVTEPRSPNRPTKKASMGEGVEALQKRKIIAISEYISKILRSYSDDEVLKIVPRYPPPQLVNDLKKECQHLEPISAMELDGAFAYRLNIAKCSIKAKIKQAQIKKQKEVEEFNLLREKKKELRRHVTERDEGASSGNDDVD